jgi:hypothetical protein
VSVFIADLGLLMRAFWGITLTVWLTALVGQPAFADKRVALVIGNSGYQNVARLSNPANDAAAITATLKDAGFDLVETKRDLKISEMRRVLRDFANSSRDADVSVVYYAGHGIEVDGANYLIPVDATLEQDIDVYDEAFSLDRVLAVVEPAKKLRLVILDACRDNPFAKTMKRTVGSRGIGRGLAKVEPNSPNTLIAFASKAGSTASDGDSKNSPFTTALVKHIAKPGLDLRKAFGFVRDDVLKDTGNRQEPYVYGSLGGDDVPLVPAKPVAAGPQSDPQSAVRRDYELALQAGDRDAWEAFLQAYSDGFYANLAKVQLKKIAAEEARTAAAEKARLAELEKARLAAEGAKQAEQSRAAVAAKAAEEIRIAAEKAKQVEQDKAAAAEKSRIAEQEKARLAAEKVKQIEQEKVAAADQAKAATDKAAVEKKEQLAALTPPADKTEQNPQTDLPRSLQTELRRVGCNTGAADGNWNAASQRALKLFNEYAGTKIDIKVASIDALDAVKGKLSRVCPLVCAHGFRADGDRCLRIVCGSGSFINDENECEKKLAAPRKPERTQAIVSNPREPNSSTASRPAPTIYERAGGCSTAGAITSGRC